ncbi:16S rRNA (cytidine(1402)-2'-O)-methyltransferase [Haematomicrobium sanguinis]|uniref:16S rRNA (cytidine(1402)-2'-O)-methyltransferase n=1 Tax=Haematomicrobium sanguinis TaxID=479106 RepID=UPI00094954C8
MNDPESVPEHLSGSEKHDGDASLDSQGTEGGGSAGFSGIVLAATPIGNPADASMRLRELLGAADIIAAEDTRMVRKLAAALGVVLSGKVVAHHEHNERDSAAALVAAAGRGQVVAVVSDAGMPAVSDPGFRVVQDAVAAGVPLTVVPGPSAVLTALALSGLPTDRFTFEGFLPRKAGERAARLAGVSAEGRTMVFFEAPHRVGETLAAMASVFGESRPAALARELTKTFEEVRRGTLGELITSVEAEPPRGEIVLVVAGLSASERAADAMGSALAAVTDRVHAGERLSGAVKEAAREFGVGRKLLYERALADRALTEGALAEGARADRPGAERSGADPD